MVMKMSMSTDILLLNIPGSHYMHPPGTKSLNIHCIHCPSSMEIGKKCKMQHYQSVVYAAQILISVPGYCHKGVRSP
jgi:hypothetical protein